MDVMLDLETFGTGPSAAIIQIGACKFDSRLHDDVQDDGFRVEVSLQSSILAGMEIEADTVLWWSKQERTTIGQTAAVTLEQALKAFCNWWPAELDPDNPVHIVWSHGLSFDVPIMDFAFRLFDMKAPWSYRNQRDTRTLFALASALGWQKPQTPTAHDGLQDAVDQAFQVQQAMRHVLRP